MDRQAFFWQVMDGKLPPPRAAATLAIAIRGELYGELVASAAATAIIRRA